MKRKLTVACAVLIALFFHVNAFAQNDFTITGTVTSLSDGKALVDATVQLKGTSISTRTDQNGGFSLRAPSATGTLIITHISHKNLEVSINGRQDISISLESNSTSLSDVVVVGYTQQSRAKTTAAISKLNAEELRNTSNPNPVQAIQGKLAGVSVPISSGQPGAGVGNIIIRGGTKVNTYGRGVGAGGGNVNGSIENSNPLFIVDGVFRPINDVPPEDIESLQVMKDAASTAIYGARGANGVIVITTKKGRFNTKPTVTLNYRSTWENPARDYDYLSASEYLTLARTTAQNTFDPLNKNNLLNNGGFSAGTRVFTQKGQYGNAVYTTALYDNIVAIEGQDYVDNLLSKGWQVMDDPINPGTKLLFADNNYQDLIWKNGLSMNYNASVEGGGENSTYYFSIGHSDQEGTFVGTNYKRYNAQGNMGFRISDNAKVDVNLNYQSIIDNKPESYTFDIARGTRITPLVRVFKDNGEPTVGENYSVRNRLHTLAYDNPKNSTERFVGKLSSDITLLKGLHYRPAISYYLENGRFFFQRKATPSTDLSQPGTQRQKNQNNNDFRQLMIDQILQYEYNLNGDHYFTALAGFNFTRTNTNTVRVGSQRAANDYIYTINEPSTTVINGVTTTNVTDFVTSLLETKSASYFGQLNYDYQAKYLLTAAIRYDGFSNFAPENKFAFFPSVAAGWNIHKENFWKGRYVSSLKLRASWGQAGSSDLSLTDTYGNYIVANYALGSGILRGNLSNPDLKWETTETTDLGFDAGFFDDRITLSVDVYNKLTKDRLDVKLLPGEAPFASIRFNNGTLQNKGVEVELGATVLKAGDFTWRSNFSFALNRTVVKELPDNGREKNRQGGDLVWDAGSKDLVFRGGLAEGERPNEMWGFRVLGVFATEAEAAEWNSQYTDLMVSAQAIQNNVKKHAGDYIFDDVNGDFKIDNKDQVFLGYRVPDKVGGMQNTFTYKGISLRFTMDYALGHLISNGALARSLGQGRASNEGAPSQAIGSDIWQTEGDAGKRYARFSFADFDFGQRNYLRTGTLGVQDGLATDVSPLIEKGDFLAFRELSITYDVPTHIVKRISLKGLSVFASVFNLGYLTKYEGLNPETYIGYDIGSYPRPRQFSVGANLRF
jgi:TonB-linked SusC/RagA family outer membrane protein